MAKTHVHYRQAIHHFNIIAASHFRAGKFDSEATRKVRRELRQAFDFYKTQIAKSKQEQLLAVLCAVQDTILVAEIGIAESCSSAAK